MIVYIAGKMTGLPRKGREAFRAAEARLKAQGHVVLNPAVLPDGLPQGAYMPICLAMLQQADAIYLLENYEDSPGAQLEFEFAWYQKKEVWLAPQEIPLRTPGGGLGTEPFTEPCVRRHSPEDAAVYAKIDKIIEGAERMLAGDS